MSIQRYDFNPISLIEDGYPETTPNNNDGQIVYYTDHAAEVERLNNHITELISDNTKFIVERDAAIARAKQAEKALRYAKFAIETTPTMNGFTQSTTLELIAAALAAAPDKPQYAELSPEP